MGVSHELKPEIMYSGPKQIAKTKSPNVNSSLDWLLIQSPINMDRNQIINTIIASSRLIYNPRISYNIQF